MNLPEALDYVLKEVQTAQKNFTKFNSYHEGYAVILEEMDELWEEVKKKDATGRSEKKLKREAIQVGAMAIRFLVDLID